MAKLKAVIANIEIDAGDDPGSLSSMLGAALAGFTGQRVETVEAPRVEAPKLVHEANGHSGGTAAPVPMKRPKKFSRKVETKTSRQSGSDNADKVAAFLQSVGGSAKIREIIAGTGVAKGSMVGAMKDPRFRKVSHGLYELANGKPASAAPSAGKPLAYRIADLLSDRPKLDALTISKELRIDRQAAVDAMNEDESRFEMDAAGLWSLV